MPYFYHNSAYLWIPEMGHG